MGRSPGARHNRNPFPHNRIRVSRAVLAVVLLAGWASLSGCSDDEAFARVSLASDTLITRDMIHVQLKDEYTTREFAPGDFQYKGGRWTSPEIRTLMSGVLTVRFLLNDPRGKLVSEGRVEIPLKKDWRWGIDLARRAEDPIGMCFGCVGSKAFPILDRAYAATDSDSVYVTWGGNSISNPVVY